MSEDAVYDTGTPSDEPAKVNEAPPAEVSEEENVEAETNEGSTDKE